MKTPIWDPSGDVLQDGFLSHNQPFKQEPPFSSVGPHLVWCLSQSIKRGLQAGLSSVFRILLRDKQVAWKYTRYLFHKKSLFRCLLCTQNNLDRFMQQLVSERNRSDCSRKTWVPLYNKTDPDELCCLGQDE